jgi:sulfate transport system permease protein
MIERKLLFNLVKPSIISGFRLTITFTIIYLFAIVIIPLFELFINTSSMRFSDFINAISSDRVLHGYKVSFGTAFIAALICSFFGFITSWVLVRYQFYGKKLLDAIIDLPFALPTAVAGIALTALYIPQGIIGRLFSPFGFKIAFTPLGIIIAMIFVGLPFVVRTIQPTLEDLDKEIEEAAIILGASQWKIFTRIILPQTMPALMTGFAAAFARGLGEFGSVIFIAGNIPGLSEIIPLIIVIKVEQYDYAGASAIALVMLLVSFSILLLINIMQRKFNIRR